MFLSPKFIWIGALSLTASVGCGSHASELAARAPSTTAPSQPSLAAARPGTGSAHHTASPDLGSEAREEPSVPLRELLSCNSKPCVAPKSLVAHLCAGKNPDVAVSMFAADSPMPRRYIRVREVDALNTLGGPSSEDKLVFDEEVIVLDGAATPKNQLSVSGANGHHVLRMDGTCATVMDDELTSKRPPAPRHAQLAWNHLDESLQATLLTDAGVKAARKLQRASCTGAGTLNANPVCQEARHNLADAVVKALERPLALPEVLVRRGS